MKYFKLYSRRLTRREVIERDLDRFRRWQGYYFKLAEDAKEYLLWIRCLRKKPKPQTPPLN
jgi:hypothetical protein